MSFSLVFCLPAVMAGSVSRLSDILSQMMSTSRSNVCLTWMLSFALVSKNSKPDIKDKRTLCGFSLFFLSDV